MINTWRQEKRSGHNNQTVRVAHSVLRGQAGCETICWTTARRCFARSAIELAHHVRLSAVVLVWPRLVPDSIAVMSSLLMMAESISLLVPVGVVIMTSDLVSAVSSEIDHAEPPHFQARDGRGRSAKVACLGVEARQILVSSLSLYILSWYSWTVCRSTSLNMMDLPELCK